MAQTRVRERLSGEQQRNQEVGGLRGRERERESPHGDLVTDWTCEVREKEELRVKLG